MVNTKLKIKKLILSGILLTGGSAFACSGMDPYIGSVCMTAVRYCPDGYLDANGQTLQVSQYQALYALIGITYGVVWEKVLICQICKVECQLVWGNHPRV